MRLLILGATGAVGAQLLLLALAHSDITLVVAPTRTPLPAHPKLMNPVINFDDVDAEADFWHVDIALCALGTTRRQAGSAAAFVHVDRDMPLALAACVKAKNARTFGVISSLGARAGGNLYLNTKAELERGIVALGFERTVIVRPALIDIRRSQRRPAEALGLWLAKALGRLLPARYRPVAPATIARALLLASLVAEPGQVTLESGALKNVGADESKSTTGAV